MGVSVKKGSRVKPARVYPAIAAGDGWVAVEASDKTIQGGIKKELQANCPELNF
jgi:hypothetical protein